MTMLEQIEQDYIAAYKQREQRRLDVLRLLKTAVKNRQVELLRPLTDEEILEVIQKQAKQRQDSIEQYTAVKREDLAANETEELHILRAYLPEPLTAAELDAAVREAIEHVSATTMADMGKVMNLVLATHKGRIDGKKASTAVRTALQQR